MEYNKTELEDLILVQNMPYDTIGKKYGVTGAAIRQNAKKLGIELPQRRKINPKETFNKGKSFSTNTCLQCGKEISEIKKYCDNKCQHIYIRQEYIKIWKSGEISGQTGVDWKNLSSHIRTYLFEKYENKCVICGWGEINPYSGTIPLEIDHIDGDSQNNTEDNLRLICPNCHSLTSTYRGLNKGKGTRNITWINKESKQD